MPSFQLSVSKEIQHTMQFSIQTFLLAAMLLALSAPILAAPLVAREPQICLPCTFICDLNGDAWCKYLKCLDRGVRQRAMEISLLESDSYVDTIEDQHRLLQQPSFWKQETEAGGGALQP